MNHRYPLLLAGLLAGPAAHAQQPWQLFRLGLGYQYHEAATPGDTTHVLRLTAGTPVAAATSDSLFRFNGRVRRISLSACGSRQRVVPDNLFGATLRSQPHAVFTLAAANGRTLTLRPRAPLGQSWATGLPGLTASVTARATASVLGSAADSVVTITFSDGGVLRVSKSYGLLAGPSLDSYLNGRNPRRALTLSALPERGLGTALTGHKAIYDFQPGDVFQRVTESYSLVGNSLCQKIWQQDSVLLRQASRTGDTLTYTVRSWQLVKGYGSSSAPAGFCQSPSTSTYAVSTTTRRYTSRMAPDQLTNAYQAASDQQHSLAVSSSSTRFAGRPEVAAETVGTCPSSSPDSLLLANIVDYYDFTRYGVGLGLTYRNSAGMYDNQITTLTAFRKGGQRWGTFVQPATLLAARAGQPAATTTAYPTPFTEALTASLVLAAPQAVGATLYDALGRPVRQLPAQALPAGARQLTLPTAGLPAGLYTLHLNFAADGHREVLKVVK